MQEIWKTVITEDGIYENYQVSNLGRVKSLNYHREKILKQRKGKDGYLRINFYKNGKMKNYMVHRLVAMAFIPNISNYNCVDHRDTNKENNKLSNLTWVTHKQNMNNELSRKKMSESQKGSTKMLGKHHSEETKNKLSEVNGKKVICLETGYIFQSTREIQRQLGINNASISLCCNKKYKQTHNMTFRYLDQVLFYN